MYQSKQQNASFFYSLFRIHRRPEMAIAQSYVHKKKKSGASIGHPVTATSAFTQSSLPSPPIPSTIYERPLKRKEAKAGRNKNYGRNQE